MYVVKRVVRLPPDKCRTEQIAGMHRLAAVWSQTNSHAAPKAFGAAQNISDIQNRGMHRGNCQLLSEAIRPHNFSIVLVKIDFVFGTISSVFIPLRSDESIGRQKYFRAQSDFRIVDDERSADIEPTNFGPQRRFVGASFFGERRK